MLFVSCRFISTSVSSAHQLALIFQIFTTCIADYHNHTLQPGQRASILVLFTAGVSACAVLVEIVSNGACVYEQEKRFRKLTGEIVQVTSREQTQVFASFGHLCVFPVFRKRWKDYADRLCFQRESDERASLFRTRTMPRSLSLSLGLSGHRLPIMSVWL